MKTPLTDTATFYANVAGRTIPVVSADYVKLMESKMTAMSRSQAFAWTVIRDANWGLQSESWKTLARSWQENVFVQDELPLTYPPNTSVRPSEPIKTMQEARVYIAKLETALRQAAKHLSDAESLENDMIAKIHHLETKLNEFQLSNRAFGAN